MRSREVTSKVEPFSSGISVSCLRQLVRFSPILLLALSFDGCTDTSKTQADLQSCREETARIVGSCLVKGIDPSIIGSEENFGDSAEEKLSACRVQKAKLETILAGIITKEEEASREPDWEQQGRDTAKSNIDFYKGLGLETWDEISKIMEKESDGEDTPGGITPKERAEIEADAERIYKKGEKEPIETPKTDDELREKILELLETSSIPKGEKETVRIFLPMMKTGDLQKIYDTLRRERQPESATVTELADVKQKLKDTEAEIERLGKEITKQQAIVEEAEAEERSADLTMGTAIKEVAQPSWARGALQKEWAKRKKTPGHTGDGMYQRAVKEKEDAKRKKEAAQAEIKRLTDKQLELQGKMPAPTPLPAKSVTPAPGLTLRRVPYDGSTTGKRTTPKEPLKGKPRPVAKPKFRRVKY